MINTNHHLNTTTTGSTGLLLIEKNTENLVNNDTKQRK